MILEKFEQLKTRLANLPGADLSASGLMNEFFGHGSCGTVGCIAGETCMMEGVTEGMLLHDTAFTQNRFFIPPRDFAADVLGLPRFKTSLFYKGQWPRILQLEYSNCKTLGEERAIMIKAIDTYIANPDSFGII